MQPDEALRQILEGVREQIREYAGDDPDKWWYANRFVFARLHGDERDTKRNVKRELLESGQPCYSCGTPFEVRRGVHIHRLDQSRGYGRGNCVLMHGPCHEDWHASGTEEGEGGTDQLLTLTKSSKLYDGAAFLYWWDITPNLAEKLSNFEAVEFVCKDSREKCALPVAELLQFLTPERQTSRGEGNWGIKVLKERPDELAFEPPAGSREWQFLGVTWLQDEAED